MERHQSALGCAGRVAVSGHARERAVFARLALRTLDGNIPDLMLVLASCVGLHLGARIPEVAKQLCRVRMAAYEAYRPGRLPG